MKVNLQSALDGLLSAGKLIVGDAKDALARVAAFVDGLKEDTGQILEAAAQAAATGGDVETWTNALNAQVDAVALNTLANAQELNQIAQEKLKAAAMGALHTVLAIAIAAV